MHPTITHSLVTDRHATLRAEADHARLVSIARGATRTAALSARSARPAQLARPGGVRRLVMRLGAA